MKTPKQWSNNPEDWYSFAGLDKELRKDGFQEEAVAFGDQLFELFLKSAEENGWEPDYDTCCAAHELCLSKDDCHRCIGFNLFWNHYAGTKESKLPKHVSRKSVDDFIYAAITGNLDVMVDSWLAGVPVEHICAE